MLPIDPTQHVASHREELLQEAERQRLIAQLPHRPSILSLGLARACLHVAGWLDSSAGYVRQDEPGPKHWAAPSGSA